VAICGYFWQAAAAGHNTLERANSLETMPKRTNDFQKLVYLVRENLADGSKVTESKLLRDRRTRSLREVDVCIEGIVAALPVVVSIECRDHKRVADVGWIDAMKAKHERLPTHALILASRSGFTPEALRVAVGYGIQTFTLETVETTDFPSLLAERSELWAKSVTLTATKVVAKVPALGDLAAESVVLVPDNILYSHNGTQLCPARDLIDIALKSSPANTKFLTDGREEHKWFELRWEPPDDLSGDPVFLEKLEPKTLRQIDSFHVTGPCEFTMTPFGLRRGKLGGVHVAWGTASVGGKKTMLVATRDSVGVEKLSVHTFDAERVRKDAP
jgi:hypothetical protein